MLPHQSALRPGLGLVSSPLKESGNNIDLQPHLPASARPLRTSYSSGEGSLTTDTSSSNGTGYTNVVASTPSLSPPPSSSSSPTANLPDTVKMSQLGEKVASAAAAAAAAAAKQPVSILSNKLHGAKITNFKQVTRTFETILPLFFNCILFFNYICTCYIVML